MVTHCRRRAPQCRDSGTLALDSDFAWGGQAAMTLLFLWALLSPFFFLALSFFL